MIKINKNTLPKVKLLMALVAFLPLGGQVGAIELQTEHWRGSWDTTVSLGSGWRVAERDDNRIGHANLAELKGLAGAARVAPVGAWSNNNDDGNLNFDKNDAFSTALKLTTEAGLEHDSGFGFFVRATGFYDFELNDDADKRRRPLAEKALDQQGENYRLLDAYVYDTWHFSESALQARLGRQVVSWGESSFIQHGLSEINAIDVTKLRVPGAELKEALIPVNTLWSSFDLSDTLSVEAFVQFDWAHFRTEEPGTYFAAQDYAGESGTSIHLLFGRVPENTPGTVARRLADKDAKDSGQFGLKLAWLVESLNYTELSFYYVNYHNKRPIISVNAHNGKEITGYFDYLEDIEMLGFSFNTSTDSGMSIAGEITYRRDEPLQIDDVELLFAALEPVGAIPAGTSQIPGGTRPGGLISGYRLFDTLQYQATFTQFMGPTLGADQWVLMAEVGANSVLDMPEKSELRFNAPATHRSGNIARARTPSNPALEGVETNPFADAFSWGYRLVSKWRYSDVWAGWNMSPRIVFLHDVNGTTPGPISNFVEDRKALTLGLGLDLQAQWKADIGYSAFFGGGTANVMGDKNFVAANVSYSF